MSRMSVLCLHRMAPENTRPESVVRLERMLPEERSDLNTIVHDANFPLPDKVREYPFDVVFLGPTFFNYVRHSSTALRKTKAAYEDVVRRATVRVALPQDEYYFSAVLDDWMIDWDIDLLYSVLEGRSDEIYPRFSRSGRIAVGFTGYITDAWINRWMHPKPRSLRKWDITYRTHNHSPIQCELQHVKFAIAHRFQQAIKEDSQLRTSISSDSRDHIPGSAWHDFVEDSRFTLATPSGSSFLDPNGDIANCIARLRATTTHATIEDARANCFPSTTPKRPFSAISPRNLEAGMALTVQIATPGDYAPFMRADEHYVGLLPDCSNIQHVLGRIRDESESAQMAMDFKESILSEPRLRRKQIAKEIIEFCESELTRRAVKRPNQADFDAMQKIYMDSAGQRVRLERRLAARKLIGRIVDSRVPRIGQALRTLRENT